MAQGHNTVQVKEVTVNAWMSKLIKQQISMSER